MAVVFEHDTNGFLRIAYPCAALCRFVQYYFEVDARSAASPVTITGLPSLSSLIAVNIGNAHALPGSSGHLRTSDVVLLGHTTRSFSGHYKSGNNIFYVKLQPGAYAALTTVRASEIQNDQVTIDALSQDFPAQAVVDAESFPARVQIAEQFLISYLDVAALTYKHDCVTAFIRSCLHNTYQVPRSIDQLCERHHITYSSLRRYFLEVAGVTPKFAQKVIRFKSALHEYKSKGYNFNYNDFGYVDFAHFCKDSKDLTELPPSKL